MTKNLVALLHLCDSLFPIGSFAHSDGLEAATTRQQIETADDLRSWMEVTLSATLRWSEGPAVRRAWEAFVRGQYATIATIDDEVHALRPTSSGRDATRAMGGRLLKTWQQIRPNKCVARLLCERLVVGRFRELAGLSVKSQRAAVVQQVGRFELRDGLQIVRCHHGIGE